MRRSYGTSIEVSAMDRYINIHSTNIFSKENETKGNRLEGGIMGGLENAGTR